MEAPTWRREIAGLRRCIQRRQLQPELGRVLYSRVCSSVGALKIRVSPVR
jgi:hypothetical protein